MNILIIGSGGREHALAWKIAQSPNCTQLFISPGNPGTALCGINVALQINDFEGLKKFSLDNDISMIVVGPEAPLVDGIADAFKSDDTKHIQVLGPSAYAAQLEGSKAFAKQFMQKYDIPTAAYLEVSQENINEGMSFLDSLSGPYVLKADGLAAGKGVLIVDKVETAKENLAEMLNGQFGKASEKVVIETFLDGIEFSVFALTDGKDFVILPEAKDYKRIGEGDTGLNTGGMGAVSPVPFVDENKKKKVINTIVKPTIDGIHTEGMDYKGFVFFGLIKVGNDPFVIEYNCRMGDPETEVVFPRIESDIITLFSDVFNGNIKNTQLKVSEKSAATVMMVSGGYPGDFEKHKVISGADQVTSSIVFHSGTTMKDGNIMTNGGRVMAITTLHEDFKEAVKISLANAAQIDYDGKTYRRDIGFDL